MLTPLAELAPPQRHEYLQQAGTDAVVRDELEQMLQAEAELGDFLEHPLLIRPEEESLVGLFLGDYRIEREIGRGGMGVVYLAQRADDVFEKNVAIKLVFPALETAERIGRFEQERRILARLDHPGIARILDGGTTPPGWPYVVMEYVNGLPLDAWCEQQQLSLPARLRLFQEVCAVVAYAHQNLIIHRDLKRRFAATARAFNQPRQSTSQHVRQITQHCGLNHIAGLAKKSSRVRSIVRRQRHTQIDRGRLMRLH